MLKVCCREAQRVMSGVKLLQKYWISLTSWCSTLAYPHNCHIDESFVSPGFANMAHWEVLEQSCGSDHNVVRMEFQSHVRYENLCNSPRCIFKRAGSSKLWVMCEKN